MLGKTLITNLLSAAILLYAAGASVTATTFDTQNSDNAQVTEAARLSASVVELFRQRQYQKAIPLAKRAVQIYEKELKPDDVRLRNARINLAELHFALGKFEDADGLLERVIKSFEDYAPKEPRLAEVLERRAVIQFAMGYHDRAEGLYKRALEINEIAFGIEHPKVATSLFHLAELYQFKGDYTRAEPLYQRVVQIREKTHRESEQLNEALDRYACLLRKLKRKDEARSLEARREAPSSPGPVEEGALGGGILNGKAISLGRPAYPEEARQARASGKVVVHVVIDEAGNVIRACPVEGLPVLWKESENAAYRTKFTPTLLSGMPVKVGGILIYNFVHQ